MQPARRRLLRSLACAAAVAAMLAPTAGYVHLAFTAHVTCAEHGELIEAGGAPHLATPPAQADRSARLSINDAWTFGHGHQHCTLAPQRRESTRDAQVRAVAAAAAPSLVARAAETLTPAPPIPLILLAPKNSPPA